MRPVSRVRVFPPHSIDTVLTSNMYFPSARAPNCAAGFAAGCSVPVRCGALFAPWAPCRIARVPRCAKRPETGPLRKLFTQAQLGDQRVVALDVLALEV